MNGFNNILYKMATPEQKKILDEQEKERIKKEEESKESNKIFLERKKRFENFKGFIQHIPGAVSGVEPEICEVDTWEKVLEIDCVKRFMKLGDLAKTTDSNPTLMVLSNLNEDTNKYKSWWVVGFLKGFTPDEIPLDNWANKIEQK